MSEERPTDVLRRLIDGAKVTQALHVAARLGLADLIAAGMRGGDDLAADDRDRSPERCCASCGRSPRPACCRRTAAGSR